MIVNIIEDKTTNNVISMESDSLEIKKIKELLNEEDLEYVSENVRNILKITKENSKTCFNVINRTKKDNCLRVILYIRLSVEDGDLIGGDLSRSIRNQLLLLLDECHKRGWKVVAIFCEDGISGADDNRPEWNLSLKFCECGGNEIVLCKSQSRFSRSMEMIEKYLHTKFVEWNIRFVGLVDSTDTSVKGNKKARQINGLVNEWQVEDQSINTREILKNKKLNGLYAVAWSPYGYIKDPKDKYHLIIDEEAAQIVRRIFDMYIQGYGTHKIAMIFNKEKIPTPLEYKKLKGSKLGSRHINKILNYQSEKEDTLKSIADRFFYTVEEIVKYNCIDDSIFDKADINLPLEDRKLKVGTIISVPSKSLWCDKTVRTILRNETYTGYLVLGRVRSNSYKDKRKKQVPKEEWIRVPHCHEPIIEREKWLMANETMSDKSSRIKSSKDGQISEFSRKVYCTCCGHFFQKVKRKFKDGEDYYLVCRTVNQTNGSMCDNNKTIRGKELRKIVLDEINKQIKKYYDLSQIEKDYYEKSVDYNVNKEIEILQNEKKNLQKAIDKKSNILTMLYEDRANGVISTEEFTMLKNKNSIDVEEYKSRISNIESNIYNLEQQKVKQLNNKKLFSKYKEITKIDRTVINEFIDTIYVGKYNEETKTRDITIKWNISSN